MESTQYRSCPPHPTICLKFPGKYDVNHAVLLSPSPSYHLSQISWYLQLDRVVPIGKDIFPTISGLQLGLQQSATIDMHIFSFTG